MADATERYTHIVWASGGSIGIDLAFGSDGTAVLEYRSGWMGSGKREFRLRFRVKRFSHRYGLMALTEAERLDSPQRWSAAEVNEAACGFHDDDERMLFFGVGYEFLRLVDGEPHIPNDPHLMDFPNAGWNLRMDLVLIARASAEALAEGGLDAELSAALAGIDKLKLERTPDAESSVTAEFRTSVVSNARLPEAGC